MTKTPLVSVIVPAKNEEAHIGTCLSNILNQDYDTGLLQVIVVDNGSSDGTVAKAREYGATVLELPRGTISELRNYGARHSDGEILAFVDADVFVKRNWISNAIRVFRETGAACVGCSPELPDQSSWVEKAWHQQVMIRPQRYKKEWLASMNMLVKREFFTRINGFNPSLYTCEDVDFGYRLSRVGDIIYDKTIGAVHVGEAKTLRGLFRKESWRGISNFEGILQHGLIMKELPSHCVALYFFALLPAFLLAIGFGSFLLALAMIFLALALPLIKTLQLVRLPSAPGPIFRMYLVWLVYCFARGYSGFLLLARRIRRPAVGGR